ncbi:HdeD family acid-resistance protein [Parahaliea mediterranea]|uniref:HdeD family acid-resistance protein n=1 Tax=Parahaliea mediterranea TaxID=651086 RepID=UPI000E2E614E|nr:HdeD family acid-resistance protein [Parahaliea mediterranea]
MTDSVTEPGLAGGAITELLGRTWWIYLIGGIAAVVFGVLALLQPGVALLILGIWFAAYLLVDGVFSAVGALGHRDKQLWWLVLIYGLLAIAIGGFLLMSPPASMLALVYTVALFTLMAGVTQLVFGFQVRKEIQGEWVLYLSGALSVALALLIVLRIGAGSLAVVYMIAGWALFVGVIRIVFAFKVRKLAKAVSAHAT